MEESPQVIDDGRHGKIWGVPPEIAALPPKDLLPFLARATLNGVARGEVPVPGTETAPVPRSDRPSPPGVSDRVTFYDCPDGRRVWLRPLSLKSQIAASKRINEDLHKAKVIRKEVAPEQVDAYLFAYNAESLYRGNLWAVLLSARTGPEKDAPLAFEPADAPAMFESEEWATPIAEMVALIEGLTQTGESELQVTREVLTRFFERQQGWAETCSSRLAALLPSPSSSNPESSPTPALSWEQTLVEQVKSALDDFAYSVCALKPQMRRWGVEEVRQLSMVLGLPPAPPAPEPRRNHLGELIEEEFCVPSLSVEA